MVVYLGDRNSESQFPTPRTLLPPPSGVTRLCVGGGEVGDGHSPSTGIQAGSGVILPGVGGGGAGGEWSGVEASEELPEVALPALDRAPGYWWSHFWVMLFQLRGGIPNWVMKSI